MKTIRLYPLFLSLLVSAALGSSAFSQTDNAKAVETITSRWIVNCNNQKDQTKLDCTMSQSILQKQSRKRIVAATIAKEGDAFSLVLSLPHGLDLLSGVAISVDDGASGWHPFSTADANGAYSKIDLTPNLIAGFKAGNTFKIEAFSAGKQKISVEMSLAGFSDSHALVTQF